VTSFKKGAKGAYTLYVQPLTPENAAEKQGRITRDAPRFKGNFCQAFKEPMQRGYTYRIDLESRDFDAFLLIRDDQGRLLALNDDRAPNDLNSRIEFTPPRSGTYEVIATSLNQGMTGEFRLRIQPLAPARK